MKSSNFVGNLVERLTRRAGRTRFVRALCFFPAIVIQAASLWRRRVSKARKVIIFLVPGDEYISGGILSIFSLYRFSQTLSAVHQAEVLMCFFPGEGRHTYHYVLFKNDVIIYPFNLALAMCFRAEQIQLHVPEYALPIVVERIGPGRLAQLRSNQDLRLNILNQNTMGMPADVFLDQLRTTLPEHLTCTTAHPSYSTEAHRRRWKMPVHHLPGWTYPDAAPATGYETKRDLMLVSPDASPHRAAVLNKIAEELPRLKIQVISGMRFEDYLKLASVAKWSLTFGEGMDDYFLSTFYRGGVGFAVYNDFFFTPEFKALRTVYPDWKTLALKIIDDIKALDNKPAMESYNTAVRPLIINIWSYDKTLAALEAFYRGNYTFP